MLDTQWSDDRVTSLKTLWLDGLSASQIARQLGGVTRNAVIGKIHRLGLGGRATPSDPARPARIVAPRERRAAPRPTAVDRPRLLSHRTQPRQDGPGLVASLASLGAHACRWPIGDPKADDFSFCGLPAKGAYCRGHAAIAYQKGKAVRLDNDPVVRRVLRGRTA